MTDAVELRLHVVGRHQIAVVEVTKIELHAGLIAPFQRNLVDGDGAFPFVHRRMVMPGRIHVGAVMGAQLHPLDRPAHTVGKLIGLQAGKQAADLLGRLLVLVISDFLQHEVGIRLDPVFQRHGNVDETARHPVLPVLLLCQKKIRKSLP